MKTLSSGLVLTVLCLLNFIACEPTSQSPPKSPPPASPPPVTVARKADLDGDSMLGQPGSNSGKETLAGSAVQDSVPFKSTKHGLKLQIPKGWSIGTTPEGNVLLRIEREGKHAFPPVIIIREIRVGTPTTPAQLKEQLRVAYRKAFKDARILSDDPVSAGGRSGFSFVVRTKGPGDADATAIRSTIGEGPVQYLAIDADLPQADLEPLKREYDTLLGSLRFFARPMPAWVKGDAPAWKEAIIQMAAATPEGDPTQWLREEMGINVGKDEIGTLTLAMRSATEDGVSGYEVESNYKVDLGNDGRQEVNMKGWFSRDLTTQRVYVEEAKTGKDRESVYYWARGRLEKGRVNITRRINGERSSWSGAAEESALFDELMEILQWQLVRLGKKRMAVPVVSLYDPQPRFWRVQMHGRHDAKSSGKALEVLLTTVLRNDGRIFTFWYGLDHRLLQRSCAGSPLVKRLKKDTKPEKAPDPDK